MSDANAVWPSGIPSVGQRATRSREVSSRDIELFTEISGDRNPLHYDEALAELTDGNPWSVGLWHEITRAADFVAF